MHQNGYYAPITTGLPESKSVHSFFRSRCIIFQVMAKSVFSTYVCMRGGLYKNAENCRLLTNSANIILLCWLLINMFYSNDGEAYIMLEWHVAKQCVSFVCFSVVEVLN